MKAVRCHRFAGLDDKGKPLSTPQPLRDVLSLEEVATPQCDEDTVLIQAHFAGVQYPDALQAQGLYQKKPALPYVPGADVAGTILEKGAGVNGLEVGDRVVAHSELGGLAEVVKVARDSVWKAPGSLPLSQCANLSRNYFAAYHALHVIGEVGPGNLVLVDGASGGVGMAAIQLGKAMGALVIAGVSREEKKAAPLAAGADRVLAYGTDLTTYRRFKDDVRQASAELGHAEGVDVVIDMVQGELFEAALVSAVRPLGKLCLIGFTAGQKPIRPGLLLIKQAAVVGSLWGPWARAHPDEHQQDVRDILGFLESGKVVPRAERVFAFEDFLQAFELFENNQGRGNTVVCVREE